MPTQQQVTNIDTAFSYTPTGGSGVQIQPVKVERKSNAANIFENLSKLALGTGQEIVQEQTASNQLMKEKTALIKEQTTLEKEKYNEYITNTTSYLNAETARLKAELVKRVANNTNGSTGIDSLLTSFSSQVDSLTDKNGKKITDEKLVNLLGVFKQNTAALMQQEYHNAYTTELKQKADNELTNLAANGTINIFTYQNIGSESQKVQQGQFNDIVATYATANNITKSEAANKVFNVLMSAQFNVNEKTTIPQLREMQSQLNYFASNIEGVTEKGNPKSFLKNQSTVGAYTNHINSMIGQLDNNIRLKLDLAMRIDNNITEVKSSINDMVSNGLITQSAGNDYLKIYQQSQIKKETELEAYRRGGGVYGYNGLTSPDSHSKFYKNDIIKDIVNGNFYSLTQTMYNAPKDAAAIIQDVVNYTSGQILNSPIGKDGKPIPFATTAKRLNEISKLIYKFPLNELPANTIEQLAVINSISEIYGNNDAAARAKYDTYLANRANGVEYSKIHLNNFKQIEKTMTDYGVQTSQRDVLLNRIKLITSLVSDETYATKTVLAPFQPFKVAGIQLTSGAALNLNVDPSLAISSKKLPLFIEGLRLYYRNIAGDTQTSLNIGQMNASGKLKIDNSGFRGGELELSDGTGMIPISTIAKQKALEYANNKLILEATPGQQPNKEIKVDEKQFIKVVPNDKTKRDNSIKFNQTKPSSTFNIDIGALFHPSMNNK